MPYHTINFSDVDTFEPMPGNEWYGVEIDKVEVRENKDGDALYLNWELVVVDGDYENRRLWYITSLKPSALYRLKTVFEELGVLGDDDEIEIEYDDDVEPSTKSGPRLLYPEIEGLEASAFVKNEMYDGREQNKVQELALEKSRRKKSKRSANGEVDSPRSKRSRRDVEDDAPVRQKRSRSRRDVEDDEDDEPVRTRSHSRRDVEDEEEDDRPRRRRQVEEDDDEDEVEERPRRRQSSSRSSGRSSGARRRIR